MMQGLKLKAEDGAIVSILYQYTPPSMYCLVSHFVRCLRFSFSFYLTQWARVGVDMFLCCLNGASIFLLLQAACLVCF